jgi:hypothetical protein
LVSIEHAIYGNWLFTVGMGQMLAFPGMEGWCLNEKFQMKNVKVTMV